eukprot:SAG25_NODE_1263_length_3466_cov_2.420552_6_plen_83_part_00
MVNFVDIDATWAQRRMRTFFPKQACLLERRPVLAEEPPEVRTSHPEGRSRCSKLTPNHCSAALHASRSGKLSTCSTSSLRRV